MKQELNNTFEEGAGESTPKSRVSEARLRLLELTPVNGICALVVDKATYQRHYKG